MKNNLIKKFCTWFCIPIILMVAQCYDATAQNPVLKDGMKITEVYQTAKYLSFDVKYTYARERTPTVVEDSLFVHFKMHDQKYQGTMDNMVFMKNDSVQVAVFLPEQMMTLSLPSEYNEMMLPITQWDSFFTKNNFVSTQEADGGYSKITVDYSNLTENPMKKFEMWYDPATYRVYRIRYKIDETTVDGALVNEGILSGEAMVVEIRFSNYQTGAFTDSVFNSRNYYSKEGSVYTAATPYSGYEVNVVSSGL